jgi:hypothetical protein
VLEVVGTVVLEVVGMVVVGALLALAPQALNATQNATNKTKIQAILLN